MAKVKEGDTVKVRFTGKLGDGTVFDTTDGQAPLSCTIGNNELITGFEQALIGMEPGEKKSIKISSDLAYGPHRGEMVIDLSKDQFPADVNPEAGMIVKIDSKDNDIMEALVIDVTESSVTIDTNHPLAGMELLFDIEIVEIVEK